MSSCISEKTADSGIRHSLSRVSRSSGVSSFDRFTEDHMFDFSRRLRHLSYINDLHDRVSRNFKEFFLYRVNLASFISLNSFIFLKATWHFSWQAVGSKFMFNSKRNFSSYLQRKL